MSQHISVWPGRDASYAEAVQSRSPDHWSLTRSLAFLAATFAIMFGTLLPSAVAASAGTGDPIMLCSGDRMLVVYNADGAPRPKSPTPMDSLKCASCVLASMTAVPPQPPVHAVVPPRIVAVHPDLPRPRPPLAPVRAGLPPPSTAPPTA